ncbi:hypothetical protein PFISCL1PPCAC_5558, partial [Pristionchus fissidentatus]
PVDKIQPEMNEDKNKENNEEITPKTHELPNKKKGKGSKKGLKSRRALNSKAKVIKKVNKIIRKSSEVSNQSPLSCPKCSHKCSNARGLDHHLRTRHRGATMITSNISLKCECGEIIRNEFYARKHKTKCSVNCYQIVKMSEINRIL